MNLQDLKAKYQTEQEQVRVEATAAEQAEQERQQAILDNLFPRIVTYLAQREGCGEEELIEFGSIAGEFQEWDDRRLSRATFTLSLPEHWPVSFSFYQDGDKMRPGSGYWTILNTGTYPETLGSALTVASQVYQEQKKYQEQEEQEGREYLAQKQTKQEQESQHQAELSALFAQVAQDPVALAMVKLFATIQQDRNGLNDQIADLEEAEGNARYHYEEALSEARSKTEQYRRQASQTEDTVRNLQYQVDDLESDLKKVKRGSQW